MLNINIADAEQGIKFEYFVRDAAHFYDTMYHIKNLLTELENLSIPTFPKPGTVIKMSDG